MKVGIWCAYHITLEASEGIGVFAHNLARGLATAPGKTEVTMVCKPGDEHLMRQTVAAGKGRIRAVALPAENRRLRRSAKLANKLHKFFTVNMQNAEGRKLRARSCTWPSARQAFRGRLVPQQAVEPVRLSLPAKLGVSLMTAPPVAYQQAVSCFHSVVKKVNRFGSRKALQWLEASSRTEVDATEDIIQACDVWVVPYVGLERQFSRPTVVTIHDLVCFHFPDTLSPEGLAIFKRVSRQVADQSTVVACMSEFIKQNDLQGILNLPEEKLRVVRPAAPSDFGGLASKQQAAAVCPIVNQRYIFYPSAFRAYKNHEALVEALALLEKRGNEDLQLVFTGIHAPSGKLAELIEQRGMKSRVHILGRVDRDVLSCIYQNAVATIVPSLYEQGSFPLMEAMHWGCPIACSRIPALTELMADMGDRMLYFDPHNYSELADVIERIMQDGAAIRASQQTARQAILGRTWTASAVDWLDVLEHARQRHTSQALPPPTRLVA